MTAKVFNFELEQGSYFEFKVSYLDKETNQIIDLDGYSARMQIRSYAGSPTIIFELTTANERIVIGEDNVITIKILATESASFTFDKALYDLEILPTGNETLARRILKGQITLSKDITR